MTASLRSPVNDLLFRAGYMLVALALMAGILGMHIMTGAHSMAAMHTVPAAAAAAVTGKTSSPPAGDAGHSTHEASGGGLTTATAPAAGPVVASSSSCTTAGTCPEVHAMDADCVLNPGNTNLSAPSPGTAPFTLPGFRDTAVISLNYSYAPDSPSPGDLSISRT